MSTQFADLATKLAEFKPARSSDVAKEQQQLSQDVSVQLQVQSRRIDTVSDSIQKFEENAADNTKLLHDLLVNMENLGDTVKQMKSDYMN